MPPEFPRRARRAAPRPASTRPASTRPASTRPTPAAPYYHRLDGLIDALARTPQDVKPGWVHSDMRCATHYLTFYLFTAPSPFRDRWNHYIALKRAGHRRDEKLYDAEGRIVEVRPNRLVAHTRYPAFERYETTICDHWLQSGKVDVDKLYEVLGALEPFDADMPVQPDRIDRRDLLLHSQLLDLDERGWCATKPHTPEEAAYRSNPPELDEDDDAAVAYLCAVNPRRCTRARDEGLRLARICSQFARHRVETRRMELMREMIRKGYRPG